MIEVKVEDWETLSRYIRLGEWVRPPSQAGMLNHLLLIGECLVTKEPLIGWRSFYITAPAIIHAEEELGNVELIKTAKIEVARLSLMDIVERSFGAGVLFERILSEDINDYKEDDISEDFALKLLEDAKEKNSFHRRASTGEDADYFHLPISSIRVEEA